MHLKSDMLQTVSCFLIALILLSTHTLNAQTQLRAKAISYRVSLELGLFDPVYYYQTDADTTEVQMEVDLYYDKTHVKTVPRILRKPADATFTPVGIYYAQDSNKQWLIDHGQKIIYVADNTAVVYKPMGEHKTILGYKCKAVLFTDFQNVRGLAYVTTKLDDNISPWGNLHIEGTILELVTSNGYHFEVTEFAEGELPPDFFDLPEYQIKTFSLSNED